MCEDMMTDGEMDLTRKYFELVYQLREKAFANYLELIKWTEMLGAGDDPADYANLHDIDNIYSNNDAWDLQGMICDFERRIHKAALREMSRNL